MGELGLIGVPRDDPHCSALVETECHVIDLEQPLDALPVSRSEYRNRLQGVSDIVVHAGQPLVNETAQRWWDADHRARRAGAFHPRELEREHRIPAARPMQVHQLTSRERAPDLLSDDVPNTADAESIQHLRRAPACGQRVGDAERRRAVAALGEKEDDRLVGHPARDEPGAAARSGRPATGRRRSRSSAAARRSPTGSVRAPPCRLGWYRARGLRCRRGPPTPRGSPGRPN